MTIAGRVQFSENLLQLIREAIPANHLAHRVLELFQGQVSRFARGFAAEGPEVCSPEVLLILLVFRHVLLKQLSKAFEMSKLQDIFKPSSGDLFEAGRGRTRNGVQKHVLNSDKEAKEMFTSQWRQ